MDEATFVTIVLAGSSLAVSIIIWVASTHAARESGNQESPRAILAKVDSEAYERARSIYEGAIDQLESEVQRLQSQLTDQSTRFSHELSNFQAELMRLNDELGRLHEKI